MECHIERVLNRDLRTIKVRYMEDCPSCNNNIEFRFHGDGFNVGLQGISHTSSSYVISNNYCHNQYFSKSKRLTKQTECGCWKKKFSSSSATNVGVAEGLHYKAVVFKQFHRALLLSLYLLFLVLPQASAVPTTISSRGAEAWNGHPSATFKKVSTTTPTKMSLTKEDVIPAYHSARAAYDRAKMLKNLFRTKDGTDQEINYAGIQAYGWLPKVPKVHSAEYKEHLDQLMLEEAILEFIQHFRMFTDPINELEKDFQYNQDLGRNISSMRGELANIIDDLSPLIKSSSVPDQDQVMTDEFRNMDKTNQAIRDWVIIRTLVEVLQYTVSVCDHFNVPL